MNTKGTLLLIDNDATSRTQLVDYFSNRGFHVETCASALQAQEKLSDESVQPAVIISDLPGTAEKLRTLRPRATVIDNKDFFIGLSQPATGEHSIVGDYPTLGELEKRYMKIVLEKTKGRKERAAKILGINRRTLYRKEREFGWVVESHDELQQTQEQRLSH